MLGDKCTRCVYAEWDEWEYYGGVSQAVICGCRKENDLDECEDFEERLEEDEE